MGGGGEEGDTAALSVSGVSLVLSNIKDTWPVCVRVCVLPMCFVSVLFMWSVFLGDCIFHSLCSAAGQRGEERGCCTVDVGITWLLFNNVSH